MVASVAPPGRAHRHEIGAILGCLVASAVSLALAPALMPESYSWVSHTTSPRGPASPPTRGAGDSSICVDLDRNGDLGRQRQSPATHDVPCSVRLVCLGGDKSLPVRKPHDISRASRRDAVKSAG